MVSKTLYFSSSFLSVFFMNQRLSRILDERPFSRINGHRDLSGDFFFFSPFIFFSGFKNKIIFLCHIKKKKFISNNKPWKQFGIGLGGCIARWKSSTTRGNNMKGREAIQVKFSPIQHEPWGQGSFRRPEYWWDYAKPKFKDRVLWLSLQVISYVYANKKITTPLPVM